MKQIIFEHPHKRKHFDFFRKMEQPQFGVTVNVDITAFLQTVRSSAYWRFTPAMVYLVARTAHELPVFTWRIRGDRVVQHDTVRPSFAVPTSAGAFSFCTVAYDQDPVVFHDRAVLRMEAMREDPSFEDEAGKDDYLYLSTFPWASFTSVQHATHLGERADSVPRIVWGKYFREGDKVLMPLSVQAHHAVVDGSDLGAYVQLIGRHLKKSSTIFKKI